MEKLTKRQKLLARHTFASYYAEALEHEKLVGFMPIPMVMKLQVLFAEENKPCKKCGSPDNPTADHILPVFFLKAFGYPADKMFRPHWYQVLCQSCNRKKLHRIDWDNPATYQILNEIIVEKPTWEYAVIKKEEAKQQAQSSFHMAKAMGEPISMREAHALHGIDYPGSPT